MLLVGFALEFLHADSSLRPEWQAWPAMASLGFLPRGLVAGHAARDLEQGAALPRVEVAIGGEQVVLALGARRIEGAGQVGQQCAGGNAEGAGEGVELVLARQLVAAHPCRHRGNAGARDRKSNRLNSS